MVKLKYIVQFAVDHLVYSYILSLLICCIHLLKDWSFHLYQYITYIFCFVALYLFLLWYEVIQFPLVILWWLYQEHQLQLVWTSFLCSTVFSIPLQGQSIYPSFHFLSILLCGQWNSKVHNFASSLLLLIILRSRRLAYNKWSVCMSKSQCSLCLLFSRTDVVLCIYHLFIWSTLNFLHRSQ